MPEQTQCTAAQRVQLLGNRAYVAGQRGQAGDVLLFCMEIPTGVRRLVLRTHGWGTVALFAARGRVPDPCLHEHRCVRIFDVNELVIDHPDCGLHYFAVVASTDFRDLLLRASYW